MLLEYIEEALGKAKYSRLKKEYYGEIPGCKGVWATGKTLAECKKNLRETLEDWLFVRLKKNLSIPSMNGKVIRPLARVSYAKAETSQVA